jgi:hypothetical protein
MCLFLVVCSLGVDALLLDYTNVRVHAFHSFSFYFKKIIKNIKKIFFYIFSNKKNKFL